MSQRLSTASVLLMLVGMPMIPMGDTAAKLLTSVHEVNPGFAAWSRFALGAILAMVVLRCLPNPSLFLDWRIWVRGSLISCAILSILTALRTEPIANVFGAFFIGPSVSYLLSVWLLKESFSWPRLGLVVVGFVSAMMVVQPGPEMSPNLLFALLAGCLYGSFLVASKWLSPVAPGRQLLLSQLVIGTVLLAPLGLSNLPPLTPAIVGLTTASAGFSALGNLLLILAYGRAHASSLAPLVYTQLIAATGLGLLVFGTWPNALALAGLCGLLASGFGAMMLRR